MSLMLQEKTLRRCSPPQGLLFWLFLFQKSSQSQHQKGGMDGAAGQKGQMAYELLENPNGPPQPMPRFSTKKWSALLRGFGLVSLDKALVRPAISLVRPYYILLWDY